MTIDGLGHIIIEKENRDGHIYYNNKNLDEQILELADDNAKSEKNEEPKLKHISAQLLENGDIFVCDYNEDTKRYVLNIYDRDNLDKPKHTLFETADKNIQNCVLFRKNNVTTILYSDDSHVFDCDSKGKHINPYKIVGTNKISIQSVIIPTDIDFVNEKKCGKIYALTDNNFSELEDVKNQRKKCNYKCHLNIEHVSYNQSNKLFIAYNKKERALVLFGNSDEGLKASKSMHIRSGVRQVMSVALSNLAEFAAVAFSNGDVEVYSLETQKALGKHTTTKTLKEQKILDMRFSDDDKDLEIATDKNLHFVKNFEDTLQIDPRTQNLW